MEQPNMMAGNMAGNMMPANMNSMQRPQQGNQQQQMYAMIMSRLNATKHQLGQGWQAIFDVSQRAVQVMQMVTQLRMLQGDPAQCLNMALNFEGKIIQSAQNKEEYHVQMKAKMQDIVRKRQENVQNNQAAQMGMQMQPNMGVPNNSMGGLLSNGMAGMNMANNGLGVPNGHMNPNENAQQNPAMLAHLQRPMQPSPIPPQQQPTTLGPAALQNNSIPPQMPMNSGMTQQQPNVNLGGQVPPGQADQRELMRAVQMLYNSMTPEQRDRMRAQYLASLSDQERAEVQAKPSDPVLRLLLPKARAELQRRRAQLQQNGNGMQMGNGQAMGGNVPQAANLQPGAPNIDFSSILAQQANALKQQEFGDQVVPASNNVNFSAGGMPQNVNPQMLSNQNGQNGNNAQLQQLLMQQQQQQRIQQQQNVKVLAQRQALQQQQQANQLRGQPGGLNAPNALNGGPAGQVNSPAMSMLNRPMAPPGQAAPGTPQSIRPQQPPQTPANPAAQLLQHHQQMMNQNNQGMNQAGQGPAQPLQQRTQQEMQQLFSHPQIRAKLASLAPEQRQPIITGLIAGQRPQDVFANLPANQQPGMAPNMNMPGAPQQGQFNGANGLPQNMGNNVPQFNGQPPPNQQPQPQQQPTMDSMQMQQRLQQQQPPPQMRIRAMDMRPFPQQLLNQLGVAVPDNVKVWGQLKEHINRHQNVLPPNTMQKVQGVQNQWFEAHPEEMNLGMQQIRANLQRQQLAQQAQQANQQQQPQPVSGPPGMQMPNGQAPPAQMIPHAAPMQAVKQNGGNIAQQGAIQASGPRPVPSPQPPTAHDIQAFRQHFGASASMTDDAIREQIWRSQREHQAKQLQAQQRDEALKHAHMQRAQQQGHGNAGVPNQQAPRGGPGGPQQQHQTSQAHAQGQQRQQQNANNDDVMEIPNPNVPPAQPAPQAPPVQGSQSQQMSAQQLPRGMTREHSEQFMKLPPEKRKHVLDIYQARQKEQAEALKKAQMGLPNNCQPSAPTATPQKQHQAPVQTPAMPPAPALATQKGQVLQRVQAMYAEVERQNPKGPAILIDDQGLQQARAMLKRLWMPMIRMHGTFVPASQLPGFETRLRAAMKAKAMISQNVVDENGNINGYLSLGLGDLKKLEGLMHAYFKELKSAKERMDAEKAWLQQGQQQANAQQAPAQGPAQLQRTPSLGGKPQPAPQQQQAPPMGKNASQQGHARKVLSKSKAPPAPTEHKTFDWGSPNPHGVPKYETGRKELTPDKLKFPPNKKRRTGQPESQDSTPAAQMSTPSALPSPSVGVKAPTPEQARKSQPSLIKQETEVERSTTIRCNEPSCDRTVMGFDNEEQLRKHEAEEHMPISDPLAFLLDNAASALGVNKDGEIGSTQKQAAVKTAPRATPMPGTKLGGKRDSQTSVVKQEVATPQSSAAAAKGPAKPVATAETTSDGPNKDKTLWELLEERMGFAPIAKPSSQEPIAAKEDDVFGDVLQTTFSGADGVGDWTSEFAGVTDWGLHPEQHDSSPELTSPSDALSESSRSSDISQSERLRINFEWDAFGNGDMLVPEVFGMQTLGLGGSPELAKGAEGEDADMADVGEKEGGDAKKAGGDEWDWSADERTDWNTLFGAHAGLEDVEPGQDGVGFGF